MTWSGTGSKGATASSGAARANGPYLPQAKPAIAVELSDFLGLGTWGFSPWALSIFGSGLRFVYS